jgi:lysophospholipase L1-like esterase
VIKSSSMMRPSNKRRLLLSLLFALASQAGSAAVRVINQGVPGESSAEVDDRLDTTLKLYKPQFVVIFVGMNDAVNDRKFLPPEQTSHHVNAMIKRTQASGANVVIVSIHQPDTARLMQRHKPEAYGSISPIQRVDTLNEVLRKIAQQDHAAFADFHDALQRAGGADVRMSTDGVHLTLKGYALLASTVRNVLPKRIDPASTVLCIGDSLTYGIGVRAPGRSPEGAETYPAQLQSILSAETTARPSR